MAESGAGVNIPRPPMGDGREGYLKGSPESRGIKAPEWKDMTAADIGAESQRLLETPLGQAVVADIGGESKLKGAARFVGEKIKGFAGHVKENWKEMAAGSAVGAVTKATVQAGLIASGLETYLVAATAAGGGASAAFKEFGKITKEEAGSPEASEKRAALKRVMRNKGRLAKAGVYGAGMAVAGYYVGHDLAPAALELLKEHTGIDVKDLAKTAAEKVGEYFNPTAHAAELDSAAGNSSGVASNPEFAKQNLVASENGTEPGFHSATTMPLQDAPDSKTELLRHNENPEPGTPNNNQYWSIDPRHYGVRNPVLPGMPPAIPQITPDAPLVPFDPEPIRPAATATPGPIPVPEAVATPQDKGLNWWDPRRLVAPQVAPFHPVIPDAAEPYLGVDPETHTPIGVKTDAPAAIVPSLPTGTEPPQLDDSDYPDPAKGKPDFYRPVHSVPPPNLDADGNPTFASSSTANPEYDPNWHEKGGVVAPPAPTITPPFQGFESPDGGDIGFRPTFPEKIALPQGSTPWAVAEQVLHLQDPEAKLTPAQIMAVDKILCQVNKIAVPEWGIEGDRLATRLPVGTELKITDEVKEAVKVALQK